MELENRLGLMEDNRFREVRKFRKKELPQLLQNIAGDDYFIDEVLGLYSSEVGHFSDISQKTFALFEQATEKIIKEKQLAYLEIPEHFHSVIEFTWQNRKEHPFLFGRFDLNGGIEERNIRIIEFNADTCTTLPETILWQNLQLNELKSTNGQLNTLSEDIKQILTDLRSSIPYDEPCFLASSFGHIEDKANCNLILDLAYKSGYSVFYENLDEVVFSEDGLFIEVGGEYQPVDVWFKIIPWDWMFNEEPGLAENLSQIIKNGQVRVLNPPYTAIWQNKLFMAYITENFSNSVIAETFKSAGSLSGQMFVEKPVYGRLGENVKLSYKTTETKGDFGRQTKVFQKFYPLEKDRESNYYQMGMFYTFRPSAINFRAEEGEIITDDCEFVSHYII